MEHLIKKYNWNKVQANTAKSMLLAGANEATIEKMVRGYGARMQSNLSLACPKCNGTMTVATLEDGRQSKYCSADRICLPLRA
jgi:hypothetical protein